MKLDETMAMAYPRKYLEHIIIGLEDPLNQHLVKLAGFDFPQEQRRHFQREVRSWLDKNSKVAPETGQPHWFDQVLLRSAL